jgi:hypothetical protein
MSRLVNIAFQGGTHGNFLRYCIDKFSTKTPNINGTPFSDNNTSHNAEINYSDTITRYHPTDNPAPYFSNTNEPHILITVSKDDLLFLERWATIRAGDFNIDTNHNEILFSKEFLTKFPWKDKIEKYYGIDLSITPAPRYIIRDFYKLSFLDKSKNGFIEVDNLLKLHMPENTFCFPLANFWEKDKFKSTLAQASRELDLGLNLSDLQVHDIFLSKLHHISTRTRALDIIQAIQSKTNIDISNIDTVEQAYLSAWIEENNRFVIVPQSNSFFKTTGEIMKWLQTYPKHYKAMNPNLPKFNGIPNPFHLWNLKK